MKRLFGRRSPTKKPQTSVSPTKKPQSTPPPPAAAAAANTTSPAKPTPDGKPPQRVQHPSPSKAAQPPKTVSTTKGETAVPPLKVPSSRESAGQLSSTSASSSSQDSRVILVRTSPPDSPAASPKVQELPSSETTVSSSNTSAPNPPEAIPPTKHIQQGGYADSSKQERNPSSPIKPASKPSSASISQRAPAKSEPTTESASDAPPDSVAQATLVHDEKDPKQNPKEEANEEPPMTMEAINYLLSMGVQVSDTQIARARCAASNDSLLVDNRMTVFAVLEGIQMTVGYKIIVPRRLSDVATPIIASTFDEVNKVINTWNSESEISRFNEATVGMPIEMSDKLREFMVMTQSLVEITEGRFDPTISPVFSLWKKCLNAGAPPTNEARHEANALVGWKDHILIEGNKITKVKSSDVRIDVGAIAKGYCVDLLVERLNAVGIEDVYVDWGSDIRATGVHPEVRSWKTAILKPPAVKDLFNMWKKKKSTGPGDFIDQLKLCGGLALATSGDYMQVQKFGYHHIVRPTTGCMFKASNTGIATTSILATNCTVADALSTAAMTFETCEEAQEWIQRVKERIPSLLVYWIYARNETFFSWKRKEHPSLYPIQPFTDKVEIFKNVCKSSVIQTAAIALASIKGKTYGCRVVFDSCSLKPAMISLLFSKNLKTESQLFDLLTEESSKGGMKISVNILNHEQSSLLSQIVCSTSLHEFATICPNATIRNTEGGVPVIENTFSRVICQIKQSICVEKSSPSVGLLLTSVESIEHEPGATLPIITHPFSHGAYELEGIEEAVSSPQQPETGLDGALRSTMRMLGGNVAVIVTQNVKAPDYISEPLGVAASSLRIASLEPPMIYVNVMSNSLMHKHLCSNANDRLLFSVHLLHNNQKVAAQTFASNPRPFITLRKAMGFSYNWFYGTVAFSDSLLSIDCQVSDIISAGDHSIVLARVVDLSQPTGGKLDPLIYSRQSYTGKLKKVS